MGEVLAVGCRRRTRRGRRPNRPGFGGGRLGADPLREDTVIPGIGIGIVTGVALAEFAIRVDDPGLIDGLMGRYGTTADNARSMLSAIATGMITVVTLLLTLTLVAVQLAAGQLSPRTIADFLGDRFQQVTIGLVPRRRGP